MVEWKLPPDYLNKHMTEEMLILLFNARTTRIRREHAEQEAQDKKPAQRVPDTDLFEAAGVAIKKI